jgi:hypothetical protein
MEVKKAPEKIYLFENPISNEPDYRWLSKRSGDEDIEYIRTDAFIKKVEDYLNSQLYDWVNITNPDQRSCANIIPKKDFIENFRNYMKGE